MNTRYESLHQRFGDKGASSVPSSIADAISHCVASRHHSRHRIVHKYSVQRAWRKNKFAKGTLGALELFASHGSCDPGSKASGRINRLARERARQLTWAFAR